MGIEQGGSGKHSEGSPSVDAATHSGGASDGTAVSQRVAGGGATVEAVGQTATSSEVGVVAVDGNREATDASAADVDVAGTGLAPTAVGDDGSPDRSSPAPDIGATALGSLVETDPAFAAGVSGLETEPSLDGKPAARVDSTAGSDAPDAYPSEQAEARADYWNMQGYQYRNYEGTCGLASSAEMMSEQSGREVSEAELTRHAAENGLCTTEADTLNPAELGGTTPEGLAVLHSEYGLESRVDAGRNQADLAAAVDRGDGVIAAVNCADYWPDEAFESRESRDAHRTSEQHNHAVWVTGVSRSPNGEVTGFYVNDTGVPDGAGKFVDSDDWARAWQARGGVMVTARRPE